MMDDKQKLERLGKLKFDNPIKFIIAEGWITLTVIGSIFTFQFLSSLKMDLIDPIIDSFLPIDLFNFMNLEIDSNLKDKNDEIEQTKTLNGEVIPVLIPQPHVLKIGNFFREFIKWCLSILILYCTGILFPFYPDENLGNTGAAIM